MATTNLVSVGVDMSQVTAFGARLPRADALMHRELEVGMERVLLTAQREAVTHAKKDTGDLRRRITRTVERIPHGVQGTIGSNAPHAETIEKGRRPGKKMPPPGALLGWMARHNIPVQEEHPGVTGSRRIKGEKGAVIGFSTRVKRDKGYWPIEFAIARKIAKKGFDGDHNMEHAVKKVVPDARRIFAEIGPRVIQRLVKGSA